MEVRLRRILSVVWMVLRRLSGEDGYEAYLSHWNTHHASSGPPLGPAEWFREETVRRWTGGPRRCC